MLSLCCVHVECIADRADSPALSIEAFEVRIEVDRVELEVFGAFLGDVWQLADEANKIQRQLAQILILEPGYDVFGAFGHCVGYIHVLEVVVGVGEDVVSMDANQAMVAVALE